MSSAVRIVEAVTCLGCGCTCDDIRVTVTGDRITAADRACRPGQQWFGDGTTPALCRIGGRTADRAAAVAELGKQLTAASAKGRALIYLSTDLNTDGQRAAVALADRLKSRIDSVSSDSVLQGILASQRRGRSAATMGELRNRADVVVFWGCDPAERYPRFRERCVPDAAGMDVPLGRAGRKVIAVDVGSGRGPADADVRVAVAPAEEVSALSLLRAAVGGRSLEGSGALGAAMQGLAGQLTGAKYCAVIFDPEPGTDFVDPHRAEGLIALTQALNAPTRAALCVLRGGGNRPGNEQVLTWQTGFPVAVDFRGGAPSYDPGRPASALLEAGALDCVLVVGDFRSVPAAVSSRFGKAAIGVIGPAASALAPAGAIAIDTGRAGIHEGGTVFRLDEVPLPLTPVVPGPAGVAEVLRELNEARR